MAQRRLTDAEYLFAAQQNERLTGAIYLGGVATEILLKAQLLDEHRWLLRTRKSDALSDEMLHLWKLCYVLHDLEGLFNNLPALKISLIRAGQSTVSPLERSLKFIIASWSIQVRYSTVVANRATTGAFLQHVREVFRWLR